MYSLHNITLACLSEEGEEEEDQQWQQRGGEGEAGDGHAEYAVLWCFYTISVPSCSKACSDTFSFQSVSRGKRGDKGKPRWTAYLLWSTRKRRDVVVDHPDWTFAQIAKWISDEWKKIDADEKDELQKEAEEMNELGIRKLPRDDDGPDPDEVGVLD